MLRLLRALWLVAVGVVGAVAWDLLRPWCPGDAFAWVAAVAAAVWAWGVYDVTHGSRRARRRRA